MERRPRADVFQSQGYRVTQSDRIPVTDPPVSDIRGTSSNYLARLTAALVTGASSMPADVRSLHVNWLTRQQAGDGGFGGREGGCDPYYTAFALRGLMVLNAIDDSIASRAADFLKSCLSSRQSIVDMISVVFGAAILEIAAGKIVLSDQDDAWRHNIADLLESLRTPDGGYAKTHEGRAGSTYQTFLTVLCLELIDMPLNRPDDVVRFIESQRSVEGGYLEIRAGKRAGVNPTAAAIGTLRCLNRNDQFNAFRTAEFLVERQTDEGGFAANTRIPFADLLSTFTGLWTLTELADQMSENERQVFSRFDLDAANRYVRQMQCESGGFIGFSLDQTADVEYSFYGLGAWALGELAKA
jgi:geranylgeranyl transferase type-2 subunit beta